MPRRFVVAVWLVVALLSCPLLLLRARAADHAAPPAGVATSYPAFDLHPAEQVAIAADPYNTQEKASIFRFKYLQYGFMPIRIIVTNNGDKPISLIDARINFITAAGDKIPAAEPEEVRAPHRRREAPGRRLQAARPPAAHREQVLDQEQRRR